MTRKNNSPLKFFLIAIAFCMSPRSMAVEFANIDVADSLVDPIVDPPTVTIPAGQSTPGFHVEAGAVTGLFPVRIGADATDDAAGGVMLSYVREIGRNQLDSLGGTETLYATSASSRRGDGSFSLVGRRAGDASLNANTLYAPGSSFNANLSAAYFPFSEGWLGGTAYNQSNGALLNELVASPGLSLGTNFQQDFFGTGDNLVTLPGVTDTRRQGLLFVGGAKNENNFGMSEPTADGSGFNVTTHDNASNGGDGEVDPVSFVFVPLGTPNITMARINGRGFGQNPQPLSMISSGGAFTISRSNNNDGEYRLSIAGQTPSSGTLLVSASGTNDGADGNNADNVVTYKPDGNDWIILTQDLAALDGVGQVNGTYAHSDFSFAFMPFNAPATAPGPIPAVATLTNFSRQRTIGWNANVTAITNDNTIDGMYVGVTEATSNVTVQPLFENRGDNVFAVDGAFLGAADGILFATVNEGLRDNRGVGGFKDYGVASVDTTFDGEWWVRTTTADPTFGNEHNINFATAFFGADTGFTMAQAVTTDATTAMVDVVIGGVNSLTDGVLIVNGSGNDDNFVTADPRSDGSGWDVTLFDDSTSPEGGGSNNINYIFLPFDADNLIAGRVNEDGTLASSTDTNDFSLTRSAEGEYLLTIPGKTPSDGMLLLTSTGEGGSVDNTLVYETVGNSFRILGLDMITEDEANNDLLFVDNEDTSFMFAYVDFDAPPELSVGVDGDFDNDNDVDGFDFLLWQRGGSPNGIASGDLAVWQSEYGNQPLAASTTQVPEPSALLLMLSASILTVFSSARRRSHGA